MGEHFQVCARCHTRYQDVYHDGLCPQCVMTTLFSDTKEKERKDFELEIAGLRVQEMIGEGGFGRVYLAEQEAVFQRRVAVKVLKAGLDTEAILRRFELEQRALGLLEHPNIARIYEVGKTARGYPYFTMEFVDGIPFTEYFCDSSLREVIEAMILVCQAISYAHERGLIHRDLKPSNILISEKRMPKVIDFGLTKAIHPERTPGMTHLTREEDFLGTPEYMAPEQAYWDSIALDERVDVFALGAVLFETLFKISPLRASGERGNRNGVTNFKIEKVTSAVWRDCQPDLKRLLQKCLQAPERRYPSVKELEEDLQRLLDGKSIRKEMSGVRKRRRFLWSAGGFVMASVGAGWFGKKSFLRFETSKQVKLRHYAMSGLASNLLMSPSAKRAIGVFRTGSQLCLLDLENGHLIRQEKWPAAIPQSACFSWDGHFFFTTHRDGTLRRFRASDGRQSGERMSLLEPELIRGIHCRGESLVNGEPLLIVREFDEKALRAYDRNGKEIWKKDTPTASWGTEFEPDGTRIAFSGKIGQVCLVDLATQALKVVKPKSRAGLSSSQTLPGKQGFLLAYYDGLVEHWSWQGVRVRWWHIGAGGQLHLRASMNGKKLALVSHSSTEVLYWSLEGNEEVQTALLKQPARSLDFSPDGRELAIACRDGSIRFFDLEKNDFKETRAQVRNEPYGIRYSLLQRDLLFVTASHDGIYVLDKRSS